MAFDAAKFLNNVYTDALDTKRTLIPEGDWRCFIQGVDVAAGNRPDACMFRISVVFDDPDLAAKEGMEGRDKIIMNQTLFVDIDPETQAIKHGGGQNWQLGKVRAACGQNNPGQPWSPSMLEEKGPLFVRVQHRELKKDTGNGRKEGTGEFLDNIVDWAAA